MEITCYSVGQPFDAAIKHWPEGIMYQYAHDMHQLLIFFHAIRSAERQAVERGMTHFGCYVEDDVITFLAKIDRPDGRKGIDWHDAPYSWHLVSPEARTIPIAPEEIPETLGVLVHIFLIDASTGIIQAMRLVNLSHDFTRRLYQAIRVQAASTFDKQRYDRQVAAQRQKFPTALDMLKAAAVTCRGGMDERKK